MEQLPEGVLVKVMQLLDVQDLLACRLLCKRLGGLALHPDAWRHRQLSIEKQCVCTVLHLAPCLDKAVYSNFEMFHRRAFTKTKCAVAELELVLAPPGPLARHTVEAAVVLRRQELLGRLRRLEVKDYFQLRSADVLLKTVLEATAALDSLVIAGTVPTTALPVQYSGKSSLKHFNFKCGPKLVNPCTEPFVNTVLAGHAATLEEVDISPGPMSPASDTTARLLARLPKLRSLTCEMLPGLHAVAQCKALRVLSLLAYPSAPWEDTLLLLRGASQLRKVSMKYTYFDLGDSDDSDAGDDVYPDYSFDLVEALGSSAATLEELTVSGFDVPTSVMDALPPMPALRELEVLMEFLMDYKLRDITPAKAPALRRLELSTDWKQCGHAWLHEDALRQVLAANPALHIVLQEPIDCPFDECKPCRVMGCHREVGWCEDEKLGVFSHDPGQCPSPEHHPTDVSWQWIRIPFGSA